MAELEGHLRERALEKARAVGAIEDLFDAIASHDREPDLWERFYLVEAIGALFRGGYRLAEVDAVLALTPVAERSPNSHLLTDPIYQHDLTALKAAFDLAQAEPVRAFQHFGPIVFTNSSGK
ncbi:hypothetical protein JQ554_28100 [Bradyrhizobium diazoefficiens]|nr:hypothetical protein [Bradyrhizobium diazoefficiens]MBR0967088.1 hypothetical protein [Bradyrhizobium diazoefficiens]MBR0979096.1 hypothetical protein [Bradyrhizobium diazoefficiens]MBR1010155.1 hypothetical protein [Bradyrhizobium diazoefficiens]MBR1017383.1 hypothetical protein [Bradyrhizobium diazoefficiens]MBR1054853.1 hypothetical protein [Bradyrhizobium diazoefficiens]